MGEKKMNREILFKAKRKDIEYEVIGNIFDNPELLEVE